MQLNAKTTALVLIDLQKGIVGTPLEPRPGAQVLATGVRLAQRFRAAGALVVLVRVAWSPDFKDLLKPPVDKPLSFDLTTLPPEWTDLPAELARLGDQVITKRQWGAFHGTELDLQLRRRGIRSVVLGGISTNFGVESTARVAWELGYELVIAEDASASSSAAMHEFSIREVLPRIGRIAGADAIELV